MIRNRVRASDESGFTLIELLVASVLLIVVVVIAGSIIRVTMSSQRSVSAVTSATNSTQAALTQLVNSVRNSSGFRVDTVNTHDQLLQARVATAETGGVTTWACDAWYFDNTKSQIRFKTSSAAITTPTATVLAGWELFVSNVLPQAGASGTAFTVSAHTLAINLSATVANTVPLSLATTVVSRSENWTGDTCFTAP